MLVVVERVVVAVALSVEGVEEVRRKTFVLARMRSFPSIRGGPL